MPYSNTRTIEVPCFVAILTWAASVILFVLSVILGATMGVHVAAPTLGASLIVAGVACCASVRVMLLRHYDAMKNAFDLGRDVGRAEVDVPLQRVR